jgi:hypothetical protein
MLDIWKVFNPELADINGEKELIDLRRRQIFSGNR